MASSSYAVLRSFMSILPSLFAAIYGYLDISDFTTGLLTVQSVRKAMGEIAQYLPVLSFCTGKKGVLVDSFRSDAVHRVVWDILL